MWTAKGHNKGHNHEKTHIYTDIKGTGANKCNYKGN